MANGHVNIVLSTKKKGTGIEDTSKGLVSISKNVVDVRFAVRKLGNVFGELGTTAGSVIANVLKGGVWGAMAEGIRLVVQWIGKWRDAAKEAAEEAAKAQEAAAERQQKALERLADVQRRVAAARQAAIADGTKLWKAERDAVNDLAKAMLELERAQARLRGDSAGVQKADDELSALDAAEQRKALVRNLNDARLRLAAANTEQRGAQKRANAAEKAAKDATSGVFAASQLKQREAQRDRNLKIRDEAKADEEKARQKASAAQADIKNAKAAIKAFDIRTQAKLVEDAAQAGEKKAEAEKKAAGERRKADAKAAEDRQKAEIAAAQAVAKERERLEREAHNQRMADLRAEIAEQSKAASRQSAIASAVQSEFDKAFAMYRDPSRAAAVIGEEKDYRADLERLHADARRYGGKWRIDELSSLMAAGDTQGVSDTLASWRKAKGFTPEVEAMVRASAAEQTKTTAEDELKKVNAELEKLSSSLESLANERNTKLDGIERNTSGLAAKVDELLAVKG